MNIMRVALPDWNPPFFYKAVPNKSCLTDFFSFLIGRQDEINLNINYLSILCIIL